MLYRILILALCALVLRGCAAKGTEAQTWTDPAPITAEIQAPWSSEPQQETLPPEITRPEPTMTANSASVEGPLVSVFDQIPVYDPGTSLDFPIQSGNAPDDLLTASYYHINSYGHFYRTPGVFRICTDPPEMRQGSHFGLFEMENGGLKKIPSHSFSQTYEIFSDTVKVEFEYALYDGQVIVTWIAPDDLDFRIHDAAVGDGKCLISFQCAVKDAMNVDYPMLLDVRTGQLTDFLQEVDISSFPSNFWQEDAQFYSFILQYTVLFEENRLLAKLIGGDYILYDPPTGKVYDLSELSDRQVAGCALTGDSIICWDDVANYWRIDWNTLLVYDVLTDVPYVEFNSGIWQGSGCSFTLYRDHEWNLHVFDFLTGEDRVLAEPEGWTIEGYRCHPSPDGRKLYMTGADGNGTFQFLIFDCDRMQFILLERENPNSVRESLSQWSADNALVVISDTSQDFYVYEWKEKEPTVTQTQEIQLPDRKDTDFVAIRDYIPDLIVDLKYAQPENFTGHTIYEFQDAYLRYGSVVKLAAVQQELKTMGLGLKLWDGFRPTAAQFKLWEIYPDDTYVANPNLGFSNHSRGNAVDVTLVDSFGRELNMPTEFDDFSGKADRDYSDCLEAAAGNAMLLQNIMEKHGFVGYYGEWWHYADSVRYEVEHCFDPALVSAWYADCNEYITLRSEPDTGAQAITRIPAGGEFTRLGKAGEFYLVEYQGERGYVLSSYAKPLS